MPVIKYLKETTTTLFNSSPPTKVDKLNDLEAHTVAEIEQT